MLKTYLFISKLDLNGNSIHAIFMSQKPVKLNLLLSIFVDLSIKNILSSDFGLVFRLALSFY